MSPENIERWVSDFGYGIILIGTYFDHFGIPLFIIFGGIAASTGTLNPIGVAVCGFLGGLIGDLFLYFLGYKTGIEYWRQFSWVRKMDKAIAFTNQMLQSKPAILIVLGRFLFAVSKIVPPFAGMVRYNTKRYVAYSITGNLLFAGLYTFLSVLSGPFIIEQLKGFKISSIVVTLLFIIILVNVMRRLTPSK
ncbi:MAG: hypothetical protein G3M70_12425 [Candidatus Nitronauta litoralis]|uniref:VTT domain-containing protein n=1 Tax=Candidatus Nitronauta litoralis TaxID=2705533 RepID=A0A7T0BXA4_9BACT|nr:MAG: hypothetical protein G3M70_12425 [Candidatus Nitronauta litoralis]